MAKVDEGGFLVRHYLGHCGANVQGLQFRRRADGAVEIWRQATEAERLPTYAGEQIRRVAIIPANEWASVVSGLCVAGEDGFSYGLALQFHVGSCTYDPDAHHHDATVDDGGA